MPLRKKRAQARQSRLDFLRQRREIPMPVRAVRTFTPDLHELVVWLKACGIDTVAMESTGVYWIPIYTSCSKPTASFPIW